MQAFFDKQGWNSKPVMVNQPTLHPVVQACGRLHVVYGTGTESAKELFRACFREDFRARGCPLTFLGKPRLKGLIAVKEIELANLLLQRHPSEQIANARLNRQGSVAIRRR